ncbi:HAUS augmin-like complex subunit 8 isoform X2 [Elgaria multicarinata webbii]|uniref:HAUS augmin-like complex subunit 8 isoform X2 n=1 Tax=Elgaria multicarinata webbii TaxID=159646 RepID=UPI002FCCF119
MAEGDTSTRPKQRGGRIVPSRYLQYERKTAGKETSDTSLSFARGPDRVASPKRPSFQKRKTLAETTASALQSTMLDKHGVSRPDLELSAINDKSRHQTPVLKPSVKSSSRKKRTLVSADGSSGVGRVCRPCASQVSSDCEDLIAFQDSQTLLLMNASIKMEKNLALLEGEGERNLFTLFEEAERLQRVVHEKKRRLQRLRKEHELTEALDRQLEVLSPVSKQGARFREEYKHFATALDSTRHELPTKDIYLGENKCQYLADLQKGLAETQGVLEKALLRHSEENARALGAAKELEEASLKLYEELPRTFAQVLDLSAGVSKESSLHYQKVCEDTLGLETAKQLYFRQAGGTAPGPVFPSAEATAPRVLFPVPPLHSSC